MAVTPLQANVHAGFVNMGAVTEPSQGGTGALQTAREGPPALPWEAAREGSHVLPWEAAREGPRAPTLGGGARGVTILQTKFGLRGRR